MVEEVPPAVTDMLVLGNPESSGIANHVEITRLKLVAETAALMLDVNCDPGSRTDRVLPVIGGSDLLMMAQMRENAHLHCDDKALSDDHSMELVPLDSVPDISVPLVVADEAGLPIAVEIEGTESGQIVAKVISVEERSVRQRACDNSTAMIKASVVALQISSAKDPMKGCVKSVFELDSRPLWGSVSVCGHRPEMEDTVMVVPNFMKIPIQMFVGDRAVGGISSSLSHITSHFFGVYDGHGGSQVANHCRDRLHLALMEELNSFKHDRTYGSNQDSRQTQWENIFTGCFSKVDDEIGPNSSGEGSEAMECSDEPVAPETVGSTAVVAVVCPSHIIVANCGDSRAVLYRGKKQSHYRLITSQIERTNMLGSKHLEARSFSGTDIASLVFLQCRGLLGTDS